MFFTRSLQLRTLYLFAVSYQNLVSFGLTDALDVEQLFLGCIGHSLNGVEARIFQFLDVTCADATLLHGDIGLIPKVNVEGEQKLCCLSQNGKCGFATIWTQTSCIWLPG